VVEGEGIGAIAGALFDLGVSSPQFDVAERGFSYRHDAPLDMRMDRSRELSADIVVNTYSAEQLATIIHDYSDERFAGRVAKAIVAHRPITGTAHLAEVVTNAIPAATRRRGGHPAKRTFQALRIEVNQELEILPVALRAAIDLLAPGARLAVLSYHSGEDRIVKSVMREAESGGCTCPAGLPCGCGATPTVKRVRVRREATPAESARNPRAASARLRVVEKITEGGK
jgi:16S rRNA (cytosine1402-N4)-methyltransferase